MDGSEGVVGLDHRRNRPANPPPRRNLRQASRILHRAPVLPTTRTKREFECCKSSSVGGPADPPPARQDARQSLGWAMLRLRHSRTSRRGENRTGFPAVATRRRHRAIRGKGWLNSGRRACRLRRGRHPGWRHAYKRLALPRLARHNQSVENPNATLQAPCTAV